MLETDWTTSGNGALSHRCVPEFALEHRTLPAYWNGFVFVEVNAPHAPALTARESLRKSNREAHTMREATALAIELLFEFENAVLARELRLRALARGVTGKRRQGARGSLRSDDIVERARRFLLKTPASVTGERGRSRLFFAAAVLVRGFCLAPDGDASILLAEFAERAEPPWSEKDQRDALVNAESVSTMEEGCFLRPFRRTSPRGRGAGRGSRGSG